MKKVLSMMLAALLLLSLVGCGEKTAAEPTAGENAASSIDTIPVEQLVTLFMDMNDACSTCYRVELDGQTTGYLLGYEGFSGSFESGYALTPQMNISPFVLAVFRLAEGQDAKTFAEDLKANANPNRWICVSADRVETRVSGRTVLFFMSPEELAEPLLQCFQEMTAADFVPEEHLVNPFEDLTMEQLYAKLYEMFGAEMYGFMDNAELTTLADAETGYGFKGLDDALFAETLLDDGYAAAFDLAPEAAYVLVLLRVAEGVDEAEVAERLKTAFDSTALKGDTVQAVVAYGNGVVIFYAGTGHWGFSGTALEMTLSTEYRMQAEYLQ